MTERSGDSSRPPSNGPSGPPTDRPTPLVELDRDYLSYIDASARPKVQANETVRIRASDLDSLVDKTRATNVLQPTRDFASAIDQAARKGLEADAARRARRRAYMMTAGLGVLSAAAVIMFAITQRAGHPAVTAPPVEAPAPVSPPALTATAAPEPRAAAVVPPDVQAPAREALEKLRLGMRACILHGIHGLPGSSPPVPVALPSPKGGPTAVAPADWRTPVWSCAHFAVAAPMSFQLQWQLVKPGVEGWGLAWIDADGDGTADAALGFRVTFGAKGELSLGEIGPVEASRAVLQLR